MFKDAWYNTYSAMNIQFSNVKEVLDKKVGPGGRILGLKKYEGSRVKVVIVGELLDDGTDLSSKGDG